MISIDDIGRRLERWQKNGHGWKARCPAHDDSSPSLSVTAGDDGRVLLKCHAGCRVEDICDRLGIKVSDLFPDREQQRHGFTLSMLAAHKRLPEDHLKALGLYDLPEGGVGIPYRNASGTTHATKRRIHLVAKQGSRWPKDTALVAYGNERIIDARELEFLVLVEGESDCWTLWFHGFPALGLPGADTVKRTLRAEHVEGIKKIYFVREPDKGGETFASAVPDRLKELGWNGELMQIEMKDAKDPSDLHIKDATAFKATFAALLEAAKPLGAKTAPAIVLIELGMALTPERIAAQKDPVPTGLGPLDAALDGGYYPGDLVVFQAMTGQGKTTFNLMVQCQGVSADPQRCGLYVSTEMRADELQARRATQVLNTNGVRCGWRDVLKGVVPLEKTREATANTKVFVLSIRPGETVLATIEAAALDLAGKFGKPPFIVTDYLQALSLGTTEDKRATVGFTAYALRDMAERLNTPILTISSVSRAAGSKEKRESSDPFELISNSKESGEIELAAAVLLNMHIDYEEDEKGWRDGKLMVVKARFGKPGEIVGLKFHGSSGRFEASLTAAINDDEWQLLAKIAKGTFTSSTQAAKSMGKNKPKWLTTIKRLRNRGLISTLQNYLVVHQSVTDRLEEHVSDE